MFKSMYWFQGVDKMFLLHSMNILRYRTYCQNHKTLEKEDDFKIQVMTLNSPIKMRHSNAAVQTDPFNLISDIISY